MTRQQHPRLPALIVLATILVVASALAVARPATASLVLALDLGQITRRADRVVVAEILSVKSYWETPAQERIVTDVEIQIAELWKGAMPATRRMTITQPGGVVGDIEMRVHGLAEFAAGERAVLFLHGSERASVVMGLGQGMRPLRFDAALGRWMVEGGDRSAAVERLPNGRFVAAPPDPRLPLEVLRERVRGLVLR